MQARTQHYSTAISDYHVSDSIADPYASRAGRSAGIVARQDPVIYSENWSKAPLDVRHVQEYHDTGVLILEDVFSAAEVEMLQQESARLRDSDVIRARPESITEPDSGAIRSVFKIHSLSPLYARLAADPRLADLARFILDDDIYIHQSRLNYKPGFRGREFYWHSDFETWHVEDGMPRMRALSMSIALTENLPSNGPLMLLPGSHRDYVVCSGVTPADHFERSLKKQEFGVPDDRNLSAMVNRYGIRTAIGKPGSVIVFDCNVMHGSNSNISPFPRSNLFFVYNAASNRLRAPYCARPPRPEYIASRSDITILGPRNKPVGQEPSFL